MKVARPICAIAILFVLTVCMLGGQKPASNVVLRVLRPFEGNPAHEVWVQPMLPAYFTFMVENGKPPTAGILSCKQAMETRASPDGKWTYSVVVLHCDGGTKLSLTGVSF